MKENFQLYMNGYAGSLGAARFASDNMPLLEERFRPDYLEEQIKILEQDIAGAPEQLPSVIDEIYRIAHETQQGFAVELRKIPVRQFTIELCELAGLDPYRIPAGAVIRAACGSAAAENNMAPVGTEAVCIGYAAEGKDITLLR